MRDKQDMTMTWLKVWAKTNPPNILPPYRVTMVQMKPRGELMDNLSSDTSTVIDSTAGIRKSWYKRADSFITNTSTTHNATDIPVNETANTAINATAYTTATAPNQDFGPTPATSTKSIGLLSIPSNIYILVKFMPVHLGPKLSRGRPQMAGGLWIWRV